MRGRWIQSGAIGIDWCYCVGVIRAKGKLTQKRDGKYPSLTEAKCIHPGQCFLS